MSTGQEMLKIAVATRNGYRIALDFALAPYYTVLTLDEFGFVIKRELRPRMNRDRFIMELQGPSRPWHQYFTSPEARHLIITLPIADCAVLLHRGMSAPLQHDIESLGIQVMLANSPEIDEAITAYYHLHTQDWQTFFSTHDDDWLGGELLF